MPIQIRRTRTPNLAPTGLLPGQLAVEMASDPIRLWVGVPTNIHPSGRLLIAPFGGTPAWSTGDVKLTLKTAADVGWLMCNDGTIGNVGSGASFADASALPLYTLLYNPPFTDALAPVQTSAGVATTRAAQGTSSNAWQNNVRLRLTLMLGRAIAIAGGGAGLTARTLGAALGAETVTQNEGTLAFHQHPWGGPFTYAEQGPGGVGYTMSSASGYTGGQGPMAIVNPTTFVNAMICL